MTRKPETIQKLETIQRLQAEGKTHKEIAAILNLKGKRPVHDFLKQQRRLDRNLPKRPGRPRQSHLSSTKQYQQEIKRLKIENQLLRDFLLFIERGCGQN